MAALLDWKMTMPEAFALPNHANLNGPTILERGTVLLWLAPVLLITLGFGIVGTIVWRRRRATGSALTDVERARLDELLRATTSKDPT